MSRLFVMALIAAACLPAGPATAPPPSRTYRDDEPAEPRFRGVGGGARITVPYQPIRPTTDEACAKVAKAAEKRARKRAKRAKREGP